MLVKNEENRPSVDMINKAWDRNDDGAGIAWREPAQKGAGVEVVWKKGLSLVEVTQLCADLPLPYVVHFRVASCGGVRPSLTHPFPVHNLTSPALEGRTKGYVLFHNGDWKGWAEAAREAVIRTKTPIPVGRWSDSRAMAWLCSIYGLGFMEFLPDQRGIAFGPEGLEIFNGPGWKMVNNILCSNDLFMGTVWTNKNYCRYGTCTATALDLAGYCAAHPNGLRTPAPPTVGARGPQPVIPFPQIAEGEIISVVVAEQLHKDKKISKNLLKSIRKAHHQLSQGGKKADRAKKELALASRSMTFVGRPN